MNLLSNEIIDDLQLNDLKIIQKTDGFKFGMDAILLSSIVKTPKNGIVYDLGTGTGIIPVLLSAKTKASKIYGVEIQEEIFEMANRSIILNNLEKKIEIINADICAVKDNFKGYQADVVVTNPPYMPIGKGMINPKDTKAASRFEVKCNLEDVMQASNYLLKQYGSLYMIHRMDRIVDVFSLMRKYQLEPKEIQMIHPKQNKAPNLILIHAVRCGKPFLKILEPIVVYNEDNEYTNKIKEIYDMI